MNKMALHLNKIQFIEFQKRNLKSSEDNELAIKYRN